MRTYWINIKYIKQYLIESKSEDEAEICNYNIKNESKNFQGFFFFLSLAEFSIEIKISEVS